MLFSDFSKKDWNTAIAQFFYDGYIQQSYNTFFDRLKARFFNKLFTYLSTTSDPLIQYKIGDRVLWLPFSHELPRIKKGYPHYAENLVRLVQTIEEDYPNLRLIDVGANIGDSVALVQQVSQIPILCIEGDRRFFEILSRNTASLPQIDISQVYLGEKNTTIRGQSQQQRGTANITLQGNDCIAIKTLDSLLEDFPTFQQSKILKIDTDGFDGKVLRGARSFLQATQPILFFEYDPFSWSQQGDRSLDIFQYLSDLNYQYFLFYDNFGDLLLSTEFDFSIFKDIHRYFLGKFSQKYCDVCAFSSQDKNSFLRFKEHEIEFIENKHLKLMTENANIL
ncbi:MAG: FkbM family methyltransferase [Jaaginema sp. PMC 1080.18]|nr:FkbM family methyltransferase [Jaaginema sp. PMC 1080.18]MEC4867504.1 FkbM family methyltransferase [Jaaginema sp. PMC 1078.18]